LLKKSSLIEVETTLCPVGEIDKGEKI